MNPTNQHKQKRPFPKIPATGGIGAFLFVLGLGFYAYKFLCVDYPDWHTPDNIMFFAILFLIYSIAKDTTIFVVRFVRYLGDLVSDLFRPAGQ